MGISKVLDGLETAIDNLVRLTRSSDVDEIRRAGEVVLSWIRSLNQELSQPLKKGPFRKLQQHMRFIELYLDRGNLKMVRSNIRSLKPEMVKLRFACAHSVSTSNGDLAINLDELSPSLYKPMLVDACKCFDAGAYPAAVVSAVCSLEGMYRDIYRRNSKKDPGRLEFKRVIDELHDGGHLQGLEEPLLQIARVYRNFSAHPSQFSPSRDESKALIQFAFAKLKVHW